MCPSKKQQDEEAASLPEAASPPGKSPPEVADESSPVTLAQLREEIEKLKAEIPGIVKSNLPWALR